MLICFPVNNNNGYESEVYGHFGSAPMFLLVDTITGEAIEQNNRDKGHGHGKCSPLKALAGQQADAIVVGGIGKGALSGLNRAGLKVFKAQAGTVSDNLTKITTGELQELTLNDTCSGHVGAHGHTHGQGSGCNCSS